MAGAKLHGRDNDLHRAIQQGNATGVRAWIDSGQSLEDRDSTATTPLGLAAYFNKPAIFDALLIAGATTNATDDGNHILFYAAWRGSRKMIQTLLDRKVDVNFQCTNATSTGQTALIGAAKGGHLNLIKLLVDHEARLDLTDRDGKTVLDYAHEYGHDDIVEYLKSLKAPGKSVVRQKPAKPHPGEKIVEKARKVLKQFSELSSRPKYKKFLARLTTLVGKKPKAYVNPNRFEIGKLKGVFAIHLPSKCWADSPDLLTDLARDAFDSGGTLVATELGQDPAKGIDCLLFPTTDKVAVILAQETSSNGTTGVDTEDIAAFVADLDKRNSFRLTICAHDTIAGEFEKPVREAIAFAKRLLEICPGDEDYSPKDVAATLKRDRAFLLWWD